MVLILAKMKMLVEAKGAEEEDIGREVKVKEMQEDREEEPDRKEDGGREAEGKVQLNERELEGGWQQWV